MAAQRPSGLIASDRTSNWGPSWVGRLDPGLIDDRRAFRPIAGQESAVVALGDEPSGWEVLEPRRRPDPNLARLALVVAAHGPAA